MSDDIAELRKEIKELKKKVEDLETQIKSLRRAHNETVENYQLV